MFGMDSLISRYLPEPDIRYKWQVSWLFEDDDCPPHRLDHENPRNAVHHMIDLFNSGRTLIHISLSRQNA